MNKILSKIARAVANGAACTAALALGVAANVAPASAVTFSGNGHNYETVVVPNGITWDAARDAAAAAGGYLVTITSPEENSFVHSLIANDPNIWINDLVFGNTVGPWIGAFQPPGSPEPAGGFEWVTGEPFVYNNWRSGEPNNAFGFESLGEDVVHFVGTGIDDFADTWNDLPMNPSGLDPNFPNPRGYIVEFQAVPEPSSTIGLIALGILGARVALKRKMQA